MPAFEEKPLIYSCSGCSSAAEAADRTARKVDRLGLADMSCIAGVGGKVGPLAAKALSGRPMVAVDGCPLACARACLAGLGLSPDRHLVLSEHGIAKRFHASPSPDELVLAEEAVVASILSLQGALSPVERTVPCSI